MSPPGKKFSARCQKRDVHSVAHRLGLCGSVLLVFVVGNIVAAFAIPDRVKKEVCNNEVYWNGGKGIGACKGIEYDEKAKKYLSMDHLMEFLPEDPGVERIAKLLNLRCRKGDGAEFGMGPVVGEPPKQPEYLDCLHRVVYERLSQYGRLNVVPADKMKEQDTMKEAAMRTHYYCVFLDEDQAKYQKDNKEGTYSYWLAVKSDENLKYNLRKVTISPIQSIKSDDTDYWVKFEKPGELKQWTEPLSQSESLISSFEKSKLNVSEARKPKRSRRTPPRNRNILRPAARRRAGPGRGVPLHDGVASQSRGSHALQGSGQLLVYGLTRSWTPTPRRSFRPRARTRGST